MVFFYHHAFKHNIKQSHFLCIIHSMYYTLCKTLHACIYLKIIVWCLNIFFFNFLIFRHNQVYLITRCIISLLSWFFLFSLLKHFLLFPFHGNNFLTFLASSSCLLCWVVSSNDDGIILVVSMVVCSYFLYGGSISLYSWACKEKGSNITFIWHFFLLFF